MSARITSPKDVKKLGTILAVWAHPDDETYCAGGLLAAAVQNGQQVICVTATRGEKGVQDESRWPAAQLGKIRTQELEKAYKILGIKNHTFMDKNDGECSKSSAQCAEQVAQLVAQYKPDSIITFGPDGLTGHTDHQAVSAWATKAGKQAGIPVYYVVMTPVMYQLYQDACTGAQERGTLVDDMFFNIDMPPQVEEEECAIHLELDKALWEKKLAALDAMPSQTENFKRQLGEYYHNIFHQEAFVLAK